MESKRFELAMSVIIQASDLLEDEPYTQQYPKIKRASQILKEALNDYRETVELARVED